MKLEIEKLQLESGKIPFDEWVDGLSPVFRARVYANLARVEAGNLGNLKSIQGKGSEDIFELRMFFGPGFRAYMGKDGGRLIILLCGGDKGTQKKDVAVAKKLWKGYKARKDG